ncbi:organic cation transporter protein-like [Nymphalis io]|uniref:organic cation transporter protein-like n=1 Tax=Inachis io TaxID=171585 RepID=UPI00216A6BA3|nr:organic cation transporter protein-like [Nymphalis io]
MAKATDAAGACDASAHDDVFIQNKDNETIPMTINNYIMKTESDTESEKVKGDQKMLSVSNNVKKKNNNSDESISETDSDIKKENRNELQRDDRDIMFVNEAPSGARYVDDNNEDKYTSQNCRHIKHNNYKEFDNVIINNIGEGGKKCNAPSKKNFQDSAEALEHTLVQLGHFGLYQRYALFLLCVPNLFSAMYSLNYVFVADQVPFRCLIKECEGQGSNFNSTTIQELLPEDQCRRYEPVSPDQLSCAREDYLNTTASCKSFLYENMDTIYAEFGLACNEWQRTLVGTVRNAALPFALIFTGYLSDGWGRRTAFCVFSGFAGALGIIKSFAPNYQLYLAMEFFEAALGYGFNSAAYVMMVELARPSLRAAFACATGVGYGLGGVLFAFIASGIPYWRDLLRTIHTPALLFPIYWFLLDESMRWLHATRRTDRALTVIRKVARWNKITLDEDLLTAAGETNDVEVKSEGNPWFSLIKSRVLMLRFAACSWCWVSASFVYYGLTISSVSVSGDKYTNFALTMAMEIVASLLIMMALERFGRKRCIFVAFLLCGISCVTPYFTSHAGTGLGLFFVGKLAITFAFNSLYVFTTELFPTGVRSSALAAVSLVGRLGSILAPQTPLLSVSVQAILYGACSGSAALVVLCIPETRRVPLPQHIRNAEKLRTPEPTLVIPTSTHL